MIRLAVFTSMFGFVFRDGVLLHIVFSFPIMKDLVGILVPPLAQLRNKELVLTTGCSEPVSDRDMLLCIAQWFHLHDEQVLQWP